MEWTIFKDLDFLVMHIVVHKFVGFATVEKFKQKENRFQYKKVGYVNTAFNLLLIFLAFRFLIP